MACEAAHKHALSCGNSRSVLSLSADAVILCTTSTIIEPLPGVAMIRIMLVDDPRLVRAGLRRVLQDTAAMEVIAAASLAHAPCRERASPSVSISAPAVPYNPHT